MSFRRYLYIILLLSFLSCQSKQEEQEWKQHHRQTQTALPAHRIISLAPSFTAILCELGLADSLVGVSNLDPYSQPGVTRMGKFLPTHSVAESAKRMRLCLKLRPTLILAHSETFVEQHCKELAPVLRIVDVELSSLEDLAAYILTIGHLTGAGEAAGESVIKIQDSLQKLLERSQDLPSRRILLVVDKVPCKVLGHGSLLFAILHRYSKVRNAASANSIVQNVEIQDLDTMAPDFIIDISGQPDPWPLQKQLAQTNKKDIAIRGNPEWLTPGPSIVDSTRDILQLLYERKF